MTNEPHWYVLQLAPNRERAAAAWLNPSEADIKRARSISDRLGSYLAQRSFGLYVPLMREKRTRGLSRHKIVVTRPLFPGYGFLPLNFSVDSDRVDLVRKSPGVIGFVQFAQALAQLAASAIARIRNDETNAMVPRRRASVFKVGESVQLEQGPFAAFPATISSLDDDSERAKVLVNIFGRKTTVSVECECLGKL
jgi:transcription termination/antitermination protein NusG